MSLYINKNGSWAQVNRSYIKNGGSWYPVKEEYIKTGGVWKPVFYEPGSAEFHIPGKYTIEVGVGAFSGTVTLIGAGGGGGGCNGNGDNHAGYGGGSGGMLTFNISVEPFQTLEFSVGSPGLRADVFFNQYVYKNYGLGKNGTNGGDTYLKNVSTNQIWTATGGQGGKGSTGDSFLPDGTGGAGGSPNGVSGGPFQDGGQRNWYHATPGGRLSLDSFLSSYNIPFGKGGDSHGNPGYWINNQDGFPGAIYFRW